MSQQGYKTDYPLALWERTIVNTEEVGINKPSCLNYLNMLIVKDA